jgi:putative transposase
LGPWRDLVRIEYPGAVYHVICRGNNRQAIFRDEQDRIRYLEKLSFYCQDKSVDLLSYRLLGNHVHRLVETPQGNLSKNDARLSDELHGLL